MSYPLLHTCHLPGFITTMMSGWPVCLKDYRVGHLSGNPLPRSSQTKQKFSLYTEMVNWHYSNL